MTVRTFTFAAVCAVLLTVCSSQVPCTDCQQCCGADGVCRPCTDGGGNGGSGGASCVPETSDELCANGLDDDCDGYVDCRDFSCDLNASVTVCPCTPTGAENTAAACGNGIDDDCDNFIDCRDFDCSRNNPNVPACCPGRTLENDNANCSDGLDNDCNGFTDCGDFACSRNGAVTICDAGRCTASGAENTALACNNGRDDDCDGYRDCADLGCAGTAACRVGAGAACDACDAGASCQSGLCAWLLAFPDLKFCSARCATDGGSPACPARMTCNGSGTCIPSRTFRCTADAGGFDQVDACGRTYTSQACPSGQRCVQDGGTARCQFPAGTKGACARCTRGSDCATSLCVVAPGETEGYCTQPCNAYVDCIQPNGAEPFDSCSPLGSTTTPRYCLNQGFGVDHSCTADKGAVVRINSCGAVVYRSTCSGSTVCARGSPTPSYPQGPVACMDPCNYLNGTSCYQGFCTSCYYTYYSSSRECCGTCDGESTCTTPY